MQSNVFLPHSLSRTWPGVLVAVTLMLLLAACGSTGSSYGSSSSTSSTSQNTTPTSSSDGSMLRTATASVGGTSETILSNSQGMTLYYRTSDVPPATVCSASCASTWPPFIVSGSTAPTSTTTLPGKLTTMTDANGKQVAYNGHPLYTFSGDLPRSSHSSSSSRRTGHRRPWPDAHALSWPFMPIPLGVRASLPSSWSSMLVLCANGDAAGTRPIHSRICPDQVHVVVFPLRFAPR